MDGKRFGEFVLERERQLGLNQKEMALRMGISAPTLSGIEAADKLDMIFKMG